MDRKQIVEVLAAYRRPGTPMYAYHFRRLPDEVVQPENAHLRRSILRDESLPPRVREHAAGALGEAGDRRAIGMLIKALDSAQLRRGAAVALGLMRAKRAVPALEAVASGCKAARWALSQFDRRQSTTQLLADLRDGHLRDIGRKLSGLDPRQRDAVGRNALRELRAVVRTGKLGQEHRWLMTVLQYYDSPEADELLAEALRLTVRRRGICPTVRGRLLRILGARRPVSAIPALIEVACQTEKPGHAQMAVACIEKTLRGRCDGTASLVGYCSRLRGQLTRLKALRSSTRPVKPPRPWIDVPGSPKWLAAVDRAIKALERLLARIPCNSPSDS